MYSTESPSLNDVLPELDGDSKRAPSTGHRQKPGRPYRSSGVKNAQFRSDRPSIGRRLPRKLARFFLVVLIGVGGTLAWQHGDEVTEMVRTWAPSLGWLLPVSTIKASAPTVTTADLKPVAIDLALVRRSIEQLGANQDQVARKQEQMTQAIATLQAAVQDISQKFFALAPPAPKAVRVPPPKPVQPGAE
jgi:hypothetical protein